MHGLNKESDKALGLIMRKTGLRPEASQPEGSGKITHRPHLDNDYSPLHDIIKITDMVCRDAGALLAWASLPGAWIDRA